MCINKTFLVITKNYKNFLMNFCSTSVSRIFLSPLKTVCEKDVNWFNVAKLRWPSKGQLTKKF